MKSIRSSAPQQKFGLLAWLEKTRVALPLKGVECRFQVSGAVASVELDQIFHQNAPRPLDCTYSFPLPAGAAVYRCELHVNGRVIRAKVEAEAEALRIYRKQKSAGRRAALVAAERENLFTLSLGNVQPGDVLVVRFAWFQVLDRAGDELRLLVPTCPGVRYIPGKPLLRRQAGRGTADDTDQVPDASRISPPRIDTLHPDAAYVSIEGRLAPSDAEGGSLSSPSHPIYVREKGESITIELSGRDAVPDCDFVLSWREPKAKNLEPQAWHWREGEETYALVQLRAPEAVKVAEAYSQDVYFLVDRSGSMSGAKWQRTCEALRAFVALLGAEDRVWITLFESDFLDFAEAPMPAPQVLVDRGFQRMEGVGTAGGTELLPAARHVLEQLRKNSADRRAVVVLITDGQVGNEGEIVDLFAQAGRLTVHTFGIDTAVNDAFLKSLARQHRGGCWLQTPDDDIAGTISALGDRLRRPVLTDLALRGRWKGTGEPLPDLHAGEIATIAFRGAAARTIEIVGRLPDGSEHRFAIGLGAVGGEAIRLLWAKERIGSLLREGRQNQAVTLAKRHNLICKGASFIAWDEAEEVSIANEEIVQPALQPKTTRVSSGKICFSVCAPPFSGTLHSFENHVPSLGEAAPGFGASLSAWEVVVNDRLAETRELLERAGIAGATIETIIASFSRHDPVASERADELRVAAHLIVQLRGEDTFTPLREVLERRLRELLRGSCEGLLEWAAEFRRPLGDIEQMKRELTRGGAPKQIFEYLLCWILEAGTIDPDRLAKVQLFVKSLSRLPFSADAAARHWQKFLRSTIDAEYEARAVAPRWSDEVEFA